VSHTAGIVEDTPNARGVVTWVLITWVSSVFGVVLTVWRGDWLSALYAANAAVCAAGWGLSAARWAEWRAIAEAERKWET
jgi:hypothetical protein